MDTLEQQVYAEHITRAKARFFGALDSLHPFDAVDALAVLEEFGSSFDGMTKGRFLLSFGVYDKRWDEFPPIQFTGQTAEELEEQELGGDFPSR